MGKIPKEAKLVFKGQIFDVYQWPQQLYDGSMATFEMLKRPDTVFVIPVTEDRKIVLADQEQPGKRWLGLLGGRVDEGEEVLDAAKRELLEESGMESSDWELLYEIEPHGKMEWTIYIYTARQARRVAEQSLDGGEKIELIYLSFDEFVTEILKPDFDGRELQFEVIDPVKKEALRQKLLGN
jgi:8-oxo-dGTP pyrophosphatase MutT (NUDIX family)